MQKVIGIVISSLLNISDLVFLEGTSTIREQPAPICMSTSHCRTKLLQLLHTKIIVQGGWI